MKRLRVLVLIREGCMPPHDPSGHSDGEVLAWRMEYDVLSALDALGHKTTSLEVRDELGPIREALAEIKPHIVFNTLEDFAGVVSFDANVVAWLELLRVPFTGCNSRGLVLSRDKALAKKVCVYHRIPTPAFLVVPRGRKPKVRRGLDFPFIVKSLREDASAGIAQASIVHDMAHLERRVAFIHEQIGDDAIVERFIDGREVYVGILGNARATSFPVWELLLDHLPEGAARIATESVKFDAGYQERHDIRSERAEGLPEGVAVRCTHLAKRLFRHLGMSGYARFDFRVDAAGDVYVLEGNANPDLSRDEDFAKSAAAGGLPYEHLVRRILSLGRSWQGQ